MNLSDFLYIGIDPTSGRRDFNYAVLDVNLNLVALDEADMEQITAYLMRQHLAVVAVNAPAKVNRGLVRQELESGNASRTRSLRGVDVRLAEYELRERGIPVAGTPSREEFCPAWMQVGFELYHKLSELGYQPQGGDDAKSWFLETHPDACFHALVEASPFPKPTLEGRLQRQLILNDRGLRVTDAMGFFEEITRFKLMKGLLPENVLYPPEQLDVLVAAYTAWLAANRPLEVTRVGDASEGQIVLPVRELKEKY